MKTALTWINDAPMEFWIGSCLLTLIVFCVIALSMWLEARDANSHGEGY